MMGGGALRPRHGLSVSPVLILVLVPVLALVLVPEPAPVLAHLLAHRDNAHARSTATHNQMRAR